MSMETEKEELSQQAAKPKSIEVDGQRVEQHSLKDQIELDRYLASKRATGRGKRGFRISKMSAGGAS